MRFDITSRTLTLAKARTIHAGDHYTYRFAVTEQGLPFDLTGAKLWFTVKAEDTDTDAEAKLQLTSASDEEIEITNPGTGLFYVYFTPARTENLTGMWQYDLQIRKASGAVETLAYGLFEFLPNITEATGTDYIRIGLDAAAVTDAVAREITT